MIQPASLLSRSHTRWRKSAALRHTYGAVYLQGEELFVLVEGIREKSLDEGSVAQRNIRRWQLRIRESHERRQNLVHSLRNRQAQYIPQPRHGREQKHATFEIIAVNTTILQKAWPSTRPIEERLFLSCVRQKTRKRRPSGRGSRAGERPRTRLRGPRSRRHQRKSRTGN